MSDQSSHTERFEELCTAYVLDTLDTEERQEFEAMLQDAEQEERETYYALQSAANQLAFNAERTEPSPAVRERLISQIQADDDQTVHAATAPETTVEEKAKSDSRRYYMALAASIALLLITLALVFFAFNQNATMNDQEAKITELESELEQKEEMLSILEARTVDLVVMSGLEINPSGYGKVIWDAEKQQALLQVSNLPQVPTGKAYQLWLIKNNKPLPSATFAVNDPSKDAFFKVEQLAEANQENANAFAITLEPEGGSQQPTGDMYLLGNVEKNGN